MLQVPQTQGTNRGGGIKIVNICVTSLLNGPLPNVHAHEVLQGLDGDGSGGDKEPEALVEAQGSLDLLKHDLVGNHVADVSLKTDKQNLMKLTLEFRVDVTSFSSISNCSNSEYWTKNVSRVRASILQYQMSMF